MPKSKRLIVFLLLFLSVVILVLFIGAVENSHKNHSGFTVNPTGYLTVELEFGTINSGGPSLNLRAAAGEIRLRKN